MLYNDAERALMAAAVQPNMRRQDVSAVSLEKIADAFHLRCSRDARILDIGPGQCDFLDIAKKRGATTVGCDFDAAIVELGRMRGHTMQQSNLRNGFPAGLGTFDGIFCRGSINVYWFAADPERLRPLLDGIAAALRPGGWMWIAPWNRPADPAAPAVARIDAIVDDWIARNAFERWTAPPPIAWAYGIAYEVPRPEVWMRVPRRSQLARWRDGLRDAWKHLSTRAR